MGSTFTVSAEDVSSRASTGMQSISTTEGSHVNFSVEYRIVGNRLVAKKIRGTTLRESVIFSITGSRLIAHRATITSQRFPIDGIAETALAVYQDDYCVTSPNDTYNNFLSSSTEERDQLIRDSDICCICYEDYSSHTRISRLPCGHLYHYRCVKEWSEIRRSCPSCRSWFGEIMSAAH